MQCNKKCINDNGKRHPWVNNSFSCYVCSCTFKKAHTLSITPKVLRGIQLKEAVDSGETLKSAKELATLE